MSDDVDLVRSLRVGDDRSTTKIYVLIAEPYHDCSDVLGAFSSVKAATGSAPSSDLEWRREGFYCANRVGVVAEAHDAARDYDYLVYEFDLDVMPEMLRSP
jgi:hypothetical protein